MNIDRGLKQMAEELFHANEYRNHSDDKWNDMLESKNAREYWIETLRQSRIIVFSSKQAEIFQGLSESYTETLDYRLPYLSTFLQFDQILPVIFGARGSFGLSCMLLIQIPKDDDELEETHNGVHAFVRSESLNGEWGILSYGWLGDVFPLFEVDEERDSVAVTRALAIACIGYINCENIYLHKEGEVPPAVNRKRERQGKKILEPYYVCRIRGMQYDSNGESTGEGAHHGFRYDVRGHFRKLTSGKTTWVRPHQRGLANELYIPKTYVVEEGVKVMR